MNPFAGYHYINAEDIIRANIRPNYIGEDSSSLLNALQPITYIATPESQKAIYLHRNVIQKLTPKPHTLTLLEGLGYESSIQGDYVYHRTSSNDEMARREHVMNEFQRFYNDLKKIKSDTLDGFKEYIQDLLRQSAEENNLDIRAQLDAVPAAQHTVRTQEQEVAAQSSHLATLRHAS